MPKYQLTERQKDILRAASRGLRKGTVKTKWSCIELPLDTDDFDVELIVDGFPDAETLSIELSDLHYFARLGLLHIAEKRGVEYTCELFEKVIHDAVDSDFEIPDHIATSAKVEAHFHGNVSSSNINIAQNMENIAQTLQSSEFLSPETKAEILDKISAIHQELNAYEETHRIEIREVTRSLNSLMDDLVDSEPDRQNLTESLARLTRAGTRLVFSSLATILVSEIVAIVLTAMSGG